MRSPMQQAPGPLHPIYAIDPATALRGSLIASHAHAPERGRPDRQHTKNQQKTITHFHMTVLLVMLQGSVAPQSACPEQWATRPHRADPPRWTRGGGRGRVVVFGSVPVPAWTYDNCRTHSGVFASRRCVCITCRGVAAAAAAGGCCGRRRWDVHSGRCVCTVRSASAHCVNAVTRLVREHRARVMHSCRVLNVCLRQGCSAPRQAVEDDGGTLGRSSVVC